MKIIINILIIFFSLLSNLYAQSTLQSGSRGYNGGMNIPMAVHAMMSNFATIWQDRCIGINSPGHCSYLAEFRRLLSNRDSRFVTVRSESKVFAYDGRERNAVNDGVQNIIISENWWNSFSMRNHTNNLSLLRVLLHEYATILGLESSDYYQFSNFLISDLINSGYKLEISVSENFIPPRCSVYFHPHTQSHDSNLNFNLSSIVDDKFVISDFKEGARFFYNYKFICTKNDRDACALEYKIFDHFLDKLIVENVKVIRVRGLIFNRNNQVENAFKNLIRSSLRDLSQCQ
jgi:hypothetical protein